MLYLLVAFTRHELLVYPIVFIGVPLSSVPLHRRLMLDWFLPTDLRISVGFFPRAHWRGGSAHLCVFLPGVEDVYEKSLHQVNCLGLAISAEVFAIFLA